MAGGNNNSGTNFFAGKPLTDQVATGFGGAMGAADTLGTSGADAMKTGFGFGTDAANGFKNAGTIAGTDLSQFFNPFKSAVIDSTMTDLNRQHDIQGMNLGDAATRAHAYGGDRFAIQQGANDRDFMALKAKTLADLNSQDYTTALTTAQNDISNKMNAATGEANIGSAMGQIGTNAASSGTSLLSNLANMGFGMGNTISGNEAASGALVNSLIQKIIDSANTQTSGWSNQDMTSLQTLLNGLPGIGSAGTQTTSSNPGALGIIGGLTSILGLL